jgi:branched-chain amino acid transport system substrate-binding protein
LKRFVVWLCVAFLVLALAGCGQQAAPPEEEEPAETLEPIKLGVQGPISGQWAYEGEGFVDAVSLLAEQLNSAGGLLGREIVVIPGDDKGDPKESALVAQKMVAEGVTAVIGSYSSSCTEPASAIYDEAGIVHITPSSTATRLTEKGYQRFFRTCFLDDRQALFVSEFLRNELEFSKLALLHDNTTYAKGLADWAKLYFEERGGEVVFFDAITPGEKDFTPSLTSVKATNPEAIYFCGYFPEGGLLAKQAKDLGIDAVFMGGDACNNPEFVQIAGLEAAEGAMISTAPLPHDLEYPEAAKFIQDFKAKYKEDPTSVYTVMAADAFRIIAEAITKTESIDPDKIAAYLRNDLKDFPGITGPINYDEKGDRLGSIHLFYRIDANGQFVAYE